MRFSVGVNSKGIIDVKTIGAIGASERLEIAKQIYRSTQDLIDHGKEAHILVDISESNATDLSDEDIMAVTIRDAEYKKIAFIGANSDEQKFLKDIIEQSSSQDKAKIFESKAQAKDWLLQ